MVNDVRKQDKTRRLVDFIFDSRNLTKSAIYFSHTFTLFLLLASPIWFQCLMPFFISLLSTFERHKPIYSIHSFSEKLKEKYSAYFKGIQQANEILDNFH